MSKLIENGWTWFGYNIKGVMTQRWLGVVVKLNVDGKREREEKEKKTKKIEVGGTESDTSMVGDNMTICMKSSSK